MFHFFHYSLSKQLAWTHPIDLQQGICIYMRTWKRNSEILIFPIFSTINWHLSLIASYAPNLLLLPPHTNPVLHILHILQCVSSFLRWYFFEIIVWQHHHRGPICKSELHHIHTLRSLKVRGLHSVELCQPQNHLFVWLVDVQHCCDGSRTVSKERECYGLFDHLGGHNRVLWILLAFDCIHGKIMGSFLWYFPLLFCAIH